MNLIKNLLNTKMKLLKNQKGLTLIELLVVIVILGIIAAIAIPAVMSNRDDATRSTNAQNLDIMQDAVNRYYTMNGNYPAKIIDLASTDATHKGGPFVDQIPTVEKIGDACVPDLKSDDTHQNGWAFENGKIRVFGTNTNSACTQ